jgi:hypothetical protein
MNRDSLVVTSATLGRRRGPLVVLRLSSRFSVYLQFLMCTSDDLEVIEESGQKLTSASFTKWNRPQIWSADETELFYKVLLT